MSPLPSDFVRRIVRLHGEAGRAWLGRLPEILAQVQHRWRLRTLSTLEPLHYSFVAFATLEDGTDAIVKAALPGTSQSNEAEALRLFSGNGAVRLLDADLSLGALLFERLVPGTTLAEVDDDNEATRAAAGMIRRLHLPAPAARSFHTVAERASDLDGLRRRFRGLTGPFPVDLVERAEARFTHLLATSGPPVLLNGDLHHHNILRAERAPWLAIDPKGVVGEAAYEAAAFLCNPIPALLDWPDLTEILLRRILLLAELTGCDSERMLAWARRIRSSPQGGTTKAISRAGKRGSGLLAF